MECLAKNKDNLGLEILNLSLSSSTNSITSTSHTTVSRGPVSRGLSSIIFYFAAHNLAGGRAAAGAGL